MSRFVVLLLLLGALPALAQDKAFEPSAKERGAALVAQGRDAGKAGDYTKALELFKEALEVFPDPSHHCYVGLAYARLQRWAQAHFAFEQCRGQALAEFPGWSEPILADVERALHDGRYARVEVTTNPVDTQVTFSTFGANEVFAAPVTLFLPLGVHQVTVSRAGYRNETIDVALQTTRRYPVYVVLQPEAAPEPVPEPAPTPAIVVEPAPPMTALTPPSEAVSTTQEPESSHLGGWLAIAGGAAAAVAGGVFHALAVDTSARASKKKADDPRYDKLLEEFRTQRTIAYVGYGLGAVGLSVGLVLLWD